MIKVYVNNKSYGVYDFIQLSLQGIFTCEEDIWINDEKSDFPCISLLIKNEFATLYYFENSESCGCASLSDNIEDNGLFTYNVISVPQRYVIRLTEAMRCIEQFANLGKRPTNISWEVL